MYYYCYNIHLFRLVKWLQCLISARKCVLFLFFFLLDAEYLRWDETSSLLFKLWMTYRISRPSKTVLNRRGCNSDCYIIACHANWMGSLCQPTNTGVILYMFVFNHAALQCNAKMNFRLLTELTVLTFGCLCLLALQVAVHNYISHRMYRLSCVSPTVLVPIILHRRNEHLCAPLINSE